MMINILLVSLGVLLLLGAGYIVFNTNSKANVFDKSNIKYSDGDNT